MRKTTMVVFLLCIATAAAADLPPLIPREVLFGNPAKTSPQLSPDGKKLAYLAPSKSGVLNLWVEDLNRHKASQLTDENHQGILYYAWAYDKNHLLYMQDQAGDENFHLYALDLKTKESKDLTPYEGAKAQNLLTDGNHPQDVLIGLNRRDPRVFDMFRVNLKTGEVVLEAENPGDVTSWTTDADFQIRAATAFRISDASTLIRVRDSREDPWRDLIVMPFEKTPLGGQVNGGNLAAGFSKDGKSLYVICSLNSDTTQLVEVDASTGKELRIVTQHPKSDLWEIENSIGEDKYEVVLDLKEHTVIAAAYDYLKPEYVVADLHFVQDFDYLKKHNTGIFEIVSRDTSNKKWIIRYLGDVQPFSYYIYDRLSKQLIFLFTEAPELKKYELAPTQPVLIRASDGMELVSYLTLPLDIPSKKLPLVLIPHDGPWLRDEWFFDPYVQWLVNRGYAVLKVNFRGSNGLGLKYLNSGNGEWGFGKMQKDLTDAVEWAIRQEIADPEKVAIVGSSFGGYAALAGITFTPNLYACAVDLVGPSDVGTLLSSIPDYWGPVKERWIRRIGGDPEHDEAFNKQISPLYHLDQVHVPLLIRQGTNDVRVKKINSDTIVQAMRQQKLDVTYVVYPDEGHAFYRPENNLDFNGRIEDFLKKCIDGRIEPFKEVNGTSAQVQ